MPPIISHGIWRWLTAFTAGARLLLPEVLPLVPAGLRPVVRANVAAGVDLRKLSRPGPRLPPWRIVAPPPATELLAAYHDAEAELGVPWAYLAVMVTVALAAVAAAAAGALHASRRAPVLMLRELG